MGETEDQALTIQRRFLKRLGKLSIQLMKKILSIPKFGEQMMQFWMKKMMNLEAQ